MKRSTSDTAAIIRTIEDSPARSHLDLRFIETILRYASAGGGPLPASTDMPLRAVDRFRRYAIFLNELDLITVAPERPLPCEWYPRVVAITGITSTGAEYLAYLMRVHAHGSDISEP